MDLAVPLLMGLGCCGLVAGFLGALLGVGGGLVVVPSLVLIFGFDFRMAVACSLVAVVASSTAASSVYVGKGLANLRLGMVLEIATTLGGITGSLIAFWISPNILTLIFSLVMIAIAVLILKKKETLVKTPVPASIRRDEKPAVGAEEVPGRLAGAYFDSFSQALVHYQVKNLSVGSFLSFVAGILSGLLGVGGGFMKVPAMNLTMGVPIKVSTATSNFMIGVTALSSLLVYFAKGDVAPLAAAPISLGVILGAFGGAKVSQKISPLFLRKIFASVLILIAIQMLLRSWRALIG